MHSKRNTYDHLSIHGHREGIAIKNIFGRLKGKSDIETFRKILHSERIWI